MNARKKQSIQRLCERLGAFRLRGPIPALMAEYAVGTPEDEHRPLDGFVGTVVSNVLRELPNGQRLVRSVWLAGDCALVEEFRIFCEQAARLVMRLLHSAGYEVGLHAPNSQAHWQWAVFELSEMRVDGTSLQLAGGDVFRRVGQSIITVGEQMLWDAEHRAKKSPFDPLIASAGNTRYWELADVVEASRAVLDIVLTQQETAEPTNSRPRRRPRNTRKIDVDGPLCKLELKMRKKLIRELGSESAADEALISQLYSQFSPRLAKMLEDVGCKVKERTIRRGSTKYADWKKYRRRTAPASVATDLGPAGRAGVEEGEAPGPSRAMAVAAEVLSGNLSKRVRGRGTTHIGKTAAEKAAENAADQLARGSGIDLPPAE